MSNICTLRGNAPVVGFARDTMPAAQYAPVGAVVLNAYWRITYRVLEHVTHPDWRGESVRVVDLDGPQAGRVREHSTRLEARDLILSIPTDTGMMHGPALPDHGPRGRGPLPAHGPAGDAARARRPPRPLRAAHRARRPRARGRRPCDRPRARTARDGPQRASRDPAGLVLLVQNVRVARVRHPCGVPAMSGAWPARMGRRIARTVAVGAPATSRPGAARPKGPPPMIVLMIAALLIVWVLAVVVCVGLGRAARAGDDLVERAQRRR
jgi:hypothetical protein